MVGKERGWGGKCTCEVGGEGGWKYEKLGSEGVPEGFREKGVVHGIRVVLLFESDVFVLALLALAGLQPLRLRDLHLGDDVVLEHHRRLYHEQFLALALGSVGGVRGAAAGVVVLDGAFEGWGSFGIGVLVVSARAGLKMKARFALADDEAGAERDFASDGVAAFVATAFVEDEGRWEADGGLADVVVDLGVDGSVALDELGEEFLLVLLLLEVVIDVVFQKLLLVQL